MQEFYDINKYKNLPPEDVMEDFKKTLEATGGKLVFLDKAKWHNLLTEEMGEVKDIPCISFYDNSSRVKLVTSIRKIRERTYEEVAKILNEFGLKKTEENKRHYRNSYIYEEEMYTFNNDYTHLNVESEVENRVLIEGDASRPCRKNDTVYEGYYITYYEFCSPITCHHLYVKSEREMQSLIKAYLCGQNLGSPFRTVRSLVNNYYDGALFDHSGSFIKNTAPIIQLITRKPLSVIKENIIPILNNINSTTKYMNENQVYVKYIYDDEYRTTDKETAEKEKEEISKYYPIITYEQIKSLTNDIPKEEFDVACIGLGSAGTNILDQIGRSKWFGKYFLCDMDKIEKKNVRNQWYYNYQVSFKKAFRSGEILKEMNDNNLKIITDDNSFQNSAYQKYDYKYIIFGLDSIDARLELLEDITSKKVSCKYIIDTRYDDLNASVYIIDTSKEKEINYYKDALLEDKKYFDKQLDNIPKPTLEDFFGWLSDHNTFTVNCRDTRDMLKDLAKANREDFDFMEKGCTFNVRCQEVGCKNFWEDVYDNCPKTIRALIKPKEETSCVRQNFIDIYKYASTFVFGALRDLEEKGNDKPFTHLEVTTDGFPKSMILMK